MQHNYRLETINDFKVNKNPYADLSFQIFQHGAKNREECLQINLIKTLYLFYPETIELIIKWYFTKDIDEVLVETINNEVLNVLKNEIIKEEATL